MKWVRNGNYTSVENAILEMSGQSKAELLAPKEVPAEQICGIKQAADIINACVNNNVPIVIVGDYDADGITSTAILTRLLLNMKATVRPIIPRRFTDGYGVSDALLEGIENSLIITVDNGIAAGEVLDKAVAENGNTVVVLDHHLADGREPKMAAAVCDPHMDGDTSPYKDYCGAGLAFKLAQYMMHSNYVDVMPDDFLVLACIGTIADSMPLTGDNRAIVMQGLRTINSGDARLSAGINQLLWRVSNGVPINEETIAFSVAPLINAPGRMYNAGGTSVLKALLCTKTEDAMVYISKMAEINDERKSTVEKWMNKICEAIDSQNHVPTPIVAFVRKMPEGIVGLVAGKIASKYHAPTIVFVEPTEGTAKGSARTYGSFDIKEMLDSMADMFLTYGGHVGAAGLSMESGKVAEFRKLAQNYCANLQTEAGAYIQYDVVLKPEGLKAAMETINAYRPLGHGVPKPVCMVEGFRAESLSEMGANKTHVKLSGNGCSIVAFNMAEQYRELGKPETVDAIGNLGENTFRGETTVQLLADDFRCHTSD